MNNSQSISLVSATLSESYDINSELSLVNQKKIKDMRHNILKLSGIVSVNLKDENFKRKTLY